MRSTKNIFCLLFACIGVLHTTMMVSIPEELTNETVINDDQTQSTKIDQQKMFDEKQINQEKENFAKNTLQKTLDNTTNQIREVRLKQGPIRFWDGAQTKSEKIEAIRQVYVKNATELQRYWNLKKIRQIIIPVEDASRNNPESFTYDVIKITPKQFEKLHELSKQIESEKSKESIQNIAQEIAEQQPELKLEIPQIKEFLINYINTLPENRIQKTNKNEQKSTSTETATHPNMQSSYWQELTPTQDQPDQVKTKNITNADIKSQLKEKVSQGLTKLKENEHKVNLSKNERRAWIRKIYQDNQQKMQKELNENNIPKIIVSIESESRNNPDSFTFDIVDLKPEQIELLKEYQKTKTAETSSYENYIKNQQNIQNVVTLASQIKETQPDLKLQTAQLAQALLRYAEKLPVTISDVSQKTTPATKTKSKTSQISTQTEESTSSFSNQAESTKNQFNTNPEKTTQPQTIIPKKAQNLNKLTVTPESQLTYKKITPDIKNALQVFKIEEQELATLTIESLRKEYLQLALKMHPDKVQNNPNATQEFQQLETAYQQILQYLKSDKPEERKTITFKEPSKIEDRITIVENPRKSLPLHTSEEEKKAEEIPNEITQQAFQEIQEDEQQLETLENGFKVVDKTYDDAEQIKDINRIIDILEPLAMNIPVNLSISDLIWIKDNINELKINKDSLNTYELNASPEMEDLLDKAKNLIENLENDYFQAGKRTTLEYFKQKVASLSDTENIQDQAAALKQKLEDSTFQDFLDDTDKQEILEEIENQEIVAETTTHLKQNDSLRESIKKYLRTYTALDRDEPNSIINLRHNSEEQQEAIKKLKSDFPEKIKEFLNNASLYTPKEWRKIAKSKQIYNQIAENLINFYNHEMQNNIETVLWVQTHKYQQPISNRPTLIDQTEEETQQPDEESDDLTKELQNYDKQEQSNKKQKVQEIINSQKKKNLRTGTYSQRAKWDKLSTQWNNSLELTTQAKELFKTANEERIKLFSVFDDPSEQYQKIADFIRQEKKLSKLIKKRQGAMFYLDTTPQNITNQIDQLDQQIADFTNKNGSEFVQALNIILEKNKMSADNLPPIKIAKLICKIIKMNGIESPDNPDWFDNQLEELSKTNLYADTLEQFTNLEQSQLFKNKIEELVYEANPNTSSQEIIEQAYQYAKDSNIF